MTPATPLPWTSELSEDDHMNATVEIKGAVGELVVSLPANGEYLKTAMKDGEYMVHAANLYPRLVDALRSMFDCESLPTTDIKIARDLLAEAEGIPS